MMRILVVDDDANIRSRVKSALKGDHTIVAAECLSQARKLLTSEAPAFIVLDRTLPDGDGVDWLKELRDQGHAIPVILLTSHADINERVDGLNSGADDYLTKPFHPDELVARVRSIGRRSSYDEHLVVGSLSIDLTQRVAHIDDSVLVLTSREFSLLATFARAPGRAFTRPELLERAWGIHNDPHTNVVDVYVRHLRSKLGTEWIETVRGVGYRMPQPALH